MEKAGMMYSVASAEVFTLQLFSVKVYTKIHHGKAFL